MSVTICHASIDENRKAKYGKAGDQTGKEVCTRTWYNKPWDFMLRYKDASVAKQAAKIAKKLANSNLVGYDQSSRNTLYQQLKKNDFNVDKYIASKVKTETDCSAFMYAVWCCLIPSMRSDNNAPTTSTMKSKFTANGFTVYTNSKYITTDEYLLPGDILDEAGSHTVMAITAGSKTNSSSIPVTPTSVTSKVPYNVIITASALNVRKGPSTSYAIVTTIHKNEVYGIIEERNGWGRLKSGAGWISLSYTKKR